MSRQTYTSQPDQRKMNIDEAIRTAGRNNDINQLLYLVQILGNQADVYTYTAVIVAAGHNQWMKLAEEAYQTALERDQVDTVMINQMIFAAGNNGRMDLVEEVFLYAFTHFQFNAKTFSTMIIVANNNNNTELAKEAYRIATQYNQVTEKTLKVFDDTLRRQENSMFIRPDQSSLMGYRHNPYSFFCTSQVAFLQNPPVVPTSVAPIDENSLTLQ